MPWFLQPWSSLPVRAALRPAQPIRAGRQPQEKEQTIPRKRQPVFGSTCSSEEKWSEPWATSSRSAISRFDVVRGQLFNDTRFGDGLGGFGEEGAEGRGVLDTGMLGSFSAFAGRLAAASSRTCRSSSRMSYSDFLEWRRRLSAPCSSKSGSSDFSTAVRPFAIASSRAFLTNLKKAVRSGEPNFSLIGAVCGRGRKRI